MNRFGLMIFAAMSLLAHGVVFAGDSLLRIHCDDADAGAEIDINGKFRGECPLDIKVKPGPLKLRVHKPVDRSRERVFELELRMGEDSVKKIDALLEERYTATGQRQEEQRLRGEKAEAERKEAARQADIAEVRRTEAARLAAMTPTQRREAADAELVGHLTRAAEAGDADAQVRLAERSQSGEGVTEDAAKAVYWYNRGAASGNELAKFLVNQVSKSSSPDDVEAVKRMLRTPKDALRSVYVRGHDNVIAMVNSDAFFAMPAGGPEYVHVYLLKPTAEKQTVSCRRSGNFALGKNGWGQFVSANKTALGGLVEIESTSSFSIGNVKTASRSTTNVVDKVYGIAFPLKIGNRFGVRYTDNWADTDRTVQRTRELSCMVTDVRIPSADSALAEAPQLICLSQSRRACT